MKRKKNTNFIVVFHKTSFFLCFYYIHLYNFTWSCSKDILFRYFVKPAKVARQMKSTKKINVYSLGGHTTNWSQNVFLFCSFLKRIFLFWNININVEWEDNFRELCLEKTQLAKYLLFSGVKNKKWDFCLNGPKKIFFFKHNYNTKHIICIYNQIYSFVQRSEHREGFDFSIFDMSVSSNLL